MEKVVLVTGASSGIGKACADYLSSKGFKVYGTSRNPAAIKAPYPMVQLDVTRPESVKHAVSEVVAKEGRIDVLINNAGYSMGGAIENFSEEEMHHDMETFFFGMTRMMKEVLPHMREKNSGTIVNISSIAGLMGIPFQGFYSASKFAIQGLCESLRIELRPYNVHVVVVNPSDMLSGVSAHRIVAKSALQPNPYYEQFRLSLEKINKDESLGSNPEMVARAIEKIIHSKRPAYQYLVGRFDQKLAVYIKKLVPARFFSWILADHYKVK